MEVNYTENKDRINLLIGMSGSVASIRMIEITQQFMETQKFNVRIVLTKNAKYFTDSAVFNNYQEFEKAQRVKVYFDGDEFKSYIKDFNSTLHIQLRNWADAILIAPMSANTLAKIANGICDNLLTTIIRAIEPNKKIFFCLAMNNFMYNKPITEKHINILKNEMGFIHIPSVVQELKCGDVGIGCIADTEDIVRIVCENLNIKGIDYKNDYK